MPLVTINPTPWARDALLLTSPTVNSQALNASNNGVAVIFLAPKTGNISKIGLNVSSKTGTPPTYRISIQGQSGHAPDGTVKGSGTAKADTATFSTGWTWFTLDSALAVTAGDKLSAVITYLSGTVDASNTITVGIRSNGNIGPQGTPYGVAESAGTWTSSSSVPAMSVQYDDGSTLPSVLAYSSTTNHTSWNSGTTGSLYRGTKWTPQGTVRLVGALVGIKPAAGADFNLALFIDANAVNQTIGVSANNDVQTVSSTLADYIPLVPTIVNAGSVIRLCVQPTTGTNMTSFVSASMADAASRQAYWGELSGTQGTSASPPVWTDAANDVYPIIPVIDQINIGNAPLLRKRRMF